MSEPMTIAEAAKELGRPPMTVYGWLKAFPSLFEYKYIGGGKLRKVTITPENLERLRKLKGDAQRREPRKGMQEPAAPAPAPANPEPPCDLGYTKLPVQRTALNTRVHKVGWWCKRCGDLMPDFRLVCRCLWEQMSEKAMQRHREESWLPAHVDLTVSRPGAPKRDKTHV